MIVQSNPRHNFLAFSAELDLSAATRQNANMNIRFLSRSHALRGNALVRRSASRIESGPHGTQSVRTWVPTRSVGTRIAILCILALAAILRLGLIRAEFWFDEIWSLEFARAASSPWQIFAGADQHHDNNHKLNTIFLWLYPAGTGWWWYRVHSFVAGLATVLVAARTAARRGPAEAIFAALLFAVNYWLVLCSAEARGYALAICFALLAFYALEGYLTHGGRRMLVLFWLSVMLGFCSHLTFLHTYLALGLWSVYDGARRRLGGRAELRRLLVCHAVPGLFFVLLYMVDLRWMQLGGAPPQPTSLVVGRLLSLGLGGPPSSAWTWPIIVIAVLVFAAGLRFLAREKQHLGVFFTAVVVGSPALFLLGKPAYLFERYFLISWAFFLLLFAYVLGRLWRHSTTGAFIAGFSTLAITAGSITQIAEFQRGGRGHFVEVLTYIDQQSPGGTIHLCGDYDFRVEKFYTFYVPYVAAPKRLHYDEQNHLPAGGCAWLLVHRMDANHPPQPRMVDANDNTYDYVQGFPAAAFGGWHWHVYRRQ